MKTGRFLKWLFASAPPVWGDADSVDLLKNRAAQGEAEAQSALGFKYVTGEGVPQDYTEALKWYRLAAAQGIAIAQSSLGLMYYEGRGVPQDYVQAHKWFNLAAAQGYANAQFLLGAMYERGEGVPQDYVQAHKWFNLAAANSTGKEAHDRAVKARDYVAARMTSA